MRLRRLVLSLAPSMFLAAASTSAGALVGAAPDEQFADRVAMVLMRGPGEAGFCSALVLDDRTLLTAAHCLRPVRDMAVHYRDAAGAPVVIPVEAAVAHPQYRPDAIRARVEVDRHRAHSNRPAAGPPFRRRRLGVRRWAGRRRSGHPDRLRFHARGRLEIGRKPAQRDARRPCAGLDCAGLGGRSGRQGRGRLFGRLRARPSGRRTARRR